ncbi:hypothetical protein LCGC14_0441220 [marine sediment metagenome]|uniref:Prohead serine protease domain-containing protein n=1 Tax=marine sediment metagenome TaxID=412755 RepID=A0A0F9SK93_9ZZZZ
MEKNIFLEAKAVGVDSKAGTVTGFATVKEVDRHGDLMLPTAFNDTLENFKKNPVLCWCHDLQALPIGKVISIDVREEGVKFTAKFASSKFAQEILQLFKEKILRAFSVQFIPKKTRDPSDEEKTLHGDELGNVIEKADLLEISPVTVPAVVNALTTKGFGSEVKRLHGWYATEQGKAEAEAEEVKEDDPEPDSKTVHDHVRAAQEFIAQSGQSLNGAKEQIDLAVEILNADEEPAEEPGDEGSGHEEEEKPDQEQASAKDQASFDTLLKNIESDLTSLEKQPAHQGGN